MDKIWEYTWRAMEECHISRAGEFRCPKDLLVDAACTCIPVVAMNYITGMSICCFRDIEGVCKWEWNEEYGVYMPTVYWKQQVLGYNLKHGLNVKDLFEDFLCRKKMDDFQYLVIRSKVTQDILNKQSVKEELLQEKSSRGMYDDYYFNLYWYCLYLQRLEKTKEEYIDVMFRFLYFLYPIYVIEILDRDLKGVLNAEVLNVSHKRVQFHIAFIQQYFECCSKIEKPINWMQCVNIIKEYCGINLNLVQEGYDTTKVNRGMNNSIKLKSLMQTQLEFFVNVRLRMKDYMDKVISIAQKTEYAPEEILQLKEFREQCRI